jgi:hypothetical protein
MLYKTRTWLAVEGFIGTHGINELKARMHYYSILFIPIISGNKNKGLLFKILET